MLLSYEFYLIITIFVRGGGGGAVTLFCLCHWNLQWKASPGLFSEEVGGLLSMIFWYLTFGSFSVQEVESVLWRYCSKNYECCRGTELDLHTYHNCAFQ